MSVRGVVHKTFANNVQGKVLHSFTLRGVDGFFGTGERQAPVEVGKSYEFETKTSPSGRISVDLSTLRPWESGEAISAPKAAGYAARSGVGGFRGGKSEEEKGFWGNREAREVRNDKLRELGATRNTAISLLNLMLANGAVKLPAKENAKEEALFKLFEHYTETLLKGQTVAAEPETEPQDTEVATTAGDQEPEWK